MEEEKLTKENVEKMNAAAEDLFGFKMFNEDLFNDGKEMSKEEYLEMLKKTQSKPASEYVEDKDRIEENGNVVKMTLPELLKMQLDDYKNRWIRSRADYENLQKRTDKEFKNGWQKGQNKFLEELLPFFDDFERMMNNELDYKGVTLVYNSLQNILKSNFISVIDPQDGDVFDETYHDAIMVVPTDDKNLDNHIKMTLTKGYKHNDEIIRYAAVSVYKYTF